MSGGPETMRRDDAPTGTCSSADAEENPTLSVDPSAPALPARSDPAAGNFEPCFLEGTRASLRKT